LQNLNYHFNFYIDKWINNIRSMNLIEFTNILVTPENISIDQTGDLENILDEYPYFQAAHFLYLNGLKNQSSFKYNNSLKKTAAFTTDRSVLFDYITSYNFNFVHNSKKKSTKESSDKIEVKEHEIVESKLKKEDTSTITEPLPIGKPFYFDTTENHSFNEWLQITSIKPIIRDKDSIPTQYIKEKEITNPVISSKRNFDLIEKFIVDNPKIKPIKSDSTINVAMDSIIEDKNLMTETLAHVYLEQKKYKKAITAFTVLSLKYPEKSSFFANQIQAIKKLQEK
jgi:hypothetical protein